MEKGIAYFLGKYKLSEFQKSVLEATSMIPKGRVKTYKQIAAEIGCPRAYRAVGTALKNNPLPIIIPCHRVIKSDFSLGKYAGVYSPKKQKLLEKEGVVIRNGKVKNKA